MLNYGLGLFGFLLNHSISRLWRLSSFLHGRVEAHRHGLLLLALIFLQNFAFNVHNLILSILCHFLNPVQIYLLLLFLLLHVFLDPFLDGFFFSPFLLFFPFVFFSLFTLDFIPSEFLNLFLPLQLSFLYLSSLFFLESSFLHFLFLFLLSFVLFLLL
jgi:hypothetical protein